MQLPLNSCRILRLTLVVREPVPLSFETDDVLDVFDLALEELSALLQLIWVAFCAGNLLEDLSDASYHQHLELLQDCLETFRQGAQVQEEVVFRVEPLDWRS